MPDARAITRLLDELLWSLRRAGFVISTTCLRRRCGPRTTAWSGSRIAGADSGIKDGMRTVGMVILMSALSAATCDSGSSKQESSQVFVAAIAAMNSAQSRALTDAPVMIITTYRSDELTRRHPLRPFLAEVGRFPGTVRIR